MSQENLTFDDFNAFYPYYLSEHSNLTCRRLHFFGTTSVILTLAYILVTQSWALLLILPVVGYGPSWVGHFFFEKNKPATFDFPFWSLRGDFCMYRDILTGKIKF